MRIPICDWAVYGIIENDIWEILALKRWNTWWMDWYYWLPSWHIEWDETLFKALQRELKEEIDIEIWEKDVEIIHMSHRVRKGDRRYFDTYFRINSYTWTLKNNETNKHSEMKFIDWKTEDLLISHLKTIFTEIEDWNSFSQIFTTN